MYISVPHLLHVYKQGIWSFHKKMKKNGGFRNDNPMVIVYLRHRTWLQSTTRFLSDWGLFGFLCCLLVMVLLLQWKVQVYFRWIYLSQFSFIYITPFPISRYFCLICHMTLLSLSSLSLHFSSGFPLSLFFFFELIMCYHV